MSKPGNIKRKPCQQRYTAEERWLINKERKRKRIHNRLAKAQQKRRAKHRELMSR
jgi:hypothetical protein